MWARGTIETRLTPQTGLVVQKELEKQRREAIATPAKSMMIYLIANVTDDNSPLAPGTVVNVLMHFNHTYWDGISGRACVGDLLRRLGERWGGDEPQLSEYKWEDEVANLSEPVLDACRVDVAALGDEFNEAQDEFITSLINSDVSLLHCILYRLPLAVLTKMLCSPAGASL